MSKNDVVIHAHQSLKDPVGYLRTLRDDIMSDEDSDEGNTIFESAIGNASMILGELSDYVSDIDAHSENEFLNVFIEHGPYTERGDLAYFSLLRSAGFSKEEIKS